MRVCKRVAAVENDTVVVNEVPPVNITVVAILSNPGVNPDAGPEIGMVDVDPGINQADEHRFRCLPASPCLWQIDVNAGSTCYKAAGDNVRDNLPGIVQAPLFRNKCIIREFMGAKQIIWGRILDQVVCPEVGDCFFDLPVRNGE